MNEEAILLKIHLLPRAFRDEICGLHGNAIRVKVTAPPIEGKANKALRRFFAEKLNLAVEQIEIVAGERSRDKTLRISGLSRVEIQRALGITLPAP
jgi:uncharacterized protein (TIGR00251 family)